MAATVLLGMVMTGLITAKSRFSHQQVSAQRRIEAVQVADQLLEHWWITGGVETNAPLSDDWDESDAQQQWPVEQLPGADELELPTAMPRNGTGIVPDNENWMWQTSEQPTGSDIPGFCVIRLELFDLRDDKQKDATLTVELIAPAPPAPSEMEDELWELNENSFER